MYDLNINLILACLLWWVLLWTLSMQLYSSLTARNPKRWIGAVLSCVVASGVLWILYHFLSLSVALLGATISGVYGDFAYFYPVGILALSVVFTMNIFYCWGKDKPIWIFQ